MQIEKTLLQTLIGPPKIECTSHIFIASEKLGILRFYVNYSKLNVITKIDCYPIQRMDECIDSLRKASFLPNHDVNSKYR